MRWKGSLELCNFTALPPFLELCQQQSCNTGLVTWLKLFNVCDPWFFSTWELYNHLKCSYIWSWCCFRNICAEVWNCFVLLKEGRPSPFQGSVFHYQFLFFVHQTWCKSFFFSEKIDEAAASLWQWESALPLLWSLDALFVENSLTSFELMSFWSGK